MYACVCVFWLYFGEITFQIPGNSAYRFSIMMHTKFMSWQLVYVDFEARPKQSAEKKQTEN